MSFFLRYVAENQESRFKFFKQLSSAQSKFKLNELHASLNRFGQVRRKKNVKGKLYLRGIKSYISPGLYLIVFVPINVFSMR